MQQETARRSNAERSKSMRASLIAAARQLFVEKGYSETATPEIVAAADVTRGALYHHFADKQALFRAVVEHESRLVAQAISGAAPSDLPPLQALLDGGRAFLDAMAEPGRTRLLLLDGPAVLGRPAMDEIDARIGGTGELRAGLVAAMRAGAVARLPVDALTAQLSATYDRAALAIAAGADRAAHEQALAGLIEGLSRLD